MIYSGLEGRYWGLLGLKLTSEKAGICLRHENFGIPESKILKPLFLLILAQKKQTSIDFCYLFGRFSKYLAPSGAKYREKGWAVTKTGEGRSTNPFWNF